MLSTQEPTIPADTFPLLLLLLLLLLAVLAKGRVRARARWVSGQEVTVLTAQEGAHRQAAATG
jgi:hypothetical protein